MSASGDENSEQEDQEMSPADSEDTVTCPNCGAEVEADARFCTSCAGALSKEAGKKAEKQAYRKAKKATRGEPKQVEQWALKAGDSFAKVPRWVKIWVPVTVALVIAVVVALMVVAAGHTPSAAIERYLGNLKKAQYNNAFKMLAPASGRFGTADFFVQWQELQSEELGRLEEFSVRKRELKSRLFGRYTESDPSQGDVYVATLKYARKTYDINIFALDDGGSWPLQSYKIKLSEGPSRVIVAPLGAEIFVDGVFAGRAEEDKDLQEALSLKDFPGTLDEAVEYVRTLIRVFDNSVIDLKALLRDLDMVAEGVQNSMERISTGSVSWQQVVDSWDQVVSQSKSFAGNVWRAAVHLYWMFGGGDDGSVRARYSRVESGLDLRNLPEGWHRVEARMPGLEPETKEFFAPETVTMKLEPDPTAENDLKAALQEYLAARSDAYLTLDPGRLMAAAGGKQLEEDLAFMADLAARGLRQASELRNLKYVSFEMLAPHVATIETDEAWNFTTYEGQNPVTVVTNQKSRVTYTLQRDVLSGRGSSTVYGPWKVTESRID